MNYPRRSGIVLHPTSLPGRYGIGSFNRAAYDFVDFLVETKQTLWQVLPLGPTGYGDSPYQSFSSFAGNPYLIAVETLVEEGLLPQQELDQAPGFPDHEVDYGAIYSWKLPLLRRAADAFPDNATAAQKEEFAQFCLENEDWLDDFALFMALKDAHGGAAWNTWEMQLRSRQPAALDGARREQAEAIHAHKFNQWLFARQWSALKHYANERDIQIIGDIPIFVAMDSADTWSEPEGFFLDEQFQPTVVAGVPPDYFSATGQLWGNPLYRWEAMASRGYSWWLRRIRAALRLYDIVRIDHFRGFAAYWEVPASEKTAINGKWVQGPGVDFFNIIRRELGELPIIAEDLGEITQDVIDLRDQFELPGMKVLQFAFSGDASEKFLPHNFTRNFVVYSGTHDNDTSWGWYRESSTEQERDFFRRYFRTDGSDAAWTLIAAALGSVADTAMVPLQDVLELGSSARMNLPGSDRGNWSWRFRPEQFTDSTVWRLKELATVYGRDPEVYEGASEVGDSVAHMAAETRGEKK